MVVDHTGARYFRYWLGAMTKLAEKQFRLNPSQWKKKTIGHIAHPGVRMTRGSQRDAYRRRIEAHYGRFWKAAVHEARRISEAEGLATIFLVGSDRLVLPLKEMFPRATQGHVALIQQDLGKLSSAALAKRLIEQISQWTAANLKKANLRERIAS
jgi:hypothetical protein